MGRFSAVIFLFTISFSLASAQTVWTEAVNHEYNVSGNWNPGFIPTIGNEVQINNGTLNISGYTSDADQGNIGYSAGSSGSVNVSGALSVWRLNYGINVGDSGTGTLRIEDGGRVVTYSGNSTVWNAGSGPGSHGEITVTGMNSVMESLNSDLVIGNGGTGVLNVEDGGRVTFDNVTFGQTHGGTSTVTVTGANSLLESSTYLNVGGNANSTLNIENGGTVRSHTASVGGFSALDIQMTVTGAGSAWNIASDLQLGYEGNVVLNVEDGGVVQSGNIKAAIVAGSMATINLKGTEGNRGELRTAYVEKGAGNVLIDFNGGQLTSTANGTLLRGFADGDVTIGDGGAILQTGSFTNEIPVGMQGAGALTKLGAGTLVLSGNNSYEGLTMVDEGTLLNNGSIAGTVTVAVGATYGGSGSIGGDLFVDGTLSPGNSPGIVNVGGNLILASTANTLIQIGGMAPGQFDQINVAGNVTLDGGLVLQILPGSILQGGTTLNFLTVGGTITGQFSSVTTSLNGSIIPSIVYVGGIPQIVLTQGSFLPFAFTGNQRAVAANLDTFSGSGQSAALFSVLNNLPGTSLAEAYDQISPDEYGAMSRSVLSYNSAQQSNMQRRFADLRAGSTGFSANGFTLLGFDRSLLVAGGGDTIAQQILSNPDKSPMRLAKDNRWGFFVNGTGQFGDLETDGNGQGYDFTTGGVNIGMDYRVTDSVVVGASLGYANSNVQTDGNGGSVQANNAKALLYASWFNKGFYVNGAVGGGGTGYDTSRNVLGSKVSGGTSGGDFTTFFGGGYDFKTGNLTIGPATSLEYSYVNVAGFTETGGLAPLQIQDQNFNSMRSRLGMLASYLFEVGDIRVIPTLNAAWQHEFMDTNQTVAAQFANGAGGVFGVQSADVPRDSAVVGLGVNVEWNRSWSTYLSYDAEATDRFLVSSVNGGVKYKF